jgi:ribosomal protein S18 acetylase RimI-like enzyme
VSSPIDIRPFRRGDREQLTALVNAHIEAVVPGWSVSVNAVLSQLEREPGEIVVDPWVTGRTTLVALRRERVVAAAHLLRYAADDRVGEAYRNAGEIRWLACLPGEAAAGDVLAGACVRELEGWGVARQCADGALPSPATYGVPACWPHVRGVLQRAGFVPGGHVEIIMAATVGDLPAAGPAPLPELGLDRTLGTAATRFTARLDGEVAGLVEVRTDMTNGGALSRLAGWGDLWELHVAERLRRRGIATWLVGQAADWLRLARVERVIAEARPEDADVVGFLRRLGWRELTRTERGWTRTP